MPKQFLIFILLFAGAISQAQERLTLEDAIEKALKHNFDILVSQTDAAKAAANNTLGNAGFLPYVGANGTVSKGSSNSNITFSDGRVQNVTNGGSYSYNGAVTLSWTLFDGGKMFILKKQLNEYEKIGEVALKAQIQSTVSQVTQLYAQAVWQQQQQFAIDTGITLAAIRMNLSLVKFQTGASAKTDYLQALVDYNARRSDSLNQQTNLIGSIASLNELMGEDAEQQYLLDDSLIINTHMAPTDEERLREDNLALDVARKNAYASKLGIGIARSYHFPLLAVNGGYNYSHSETQAGYSSSSTNYGPNGNLTLSVPIFQGFNINRTVKVASLQAMRDELLYGKQQLELSRQYRSTWFAYKTSVKAYHLEHQNIKAARENLYIQEERFKVGVSTTLDARQAENDYVQALLRFYTSIYNVKVNQTKVLELESKLVQ